MGEEKCRRRRRKKALLRGEETRSGASDPSEEKNAAADNPDVLEKLKGYAAAAHVPVQPGEVYDRGLVEKDRKYKEGMPSPMPKGKKKRSANTAS